jgi:CheY-like chemotaxis protein
MSRVLVVDDDKSVASAIQALLESEGFDVVVARDGRAGLLALESGTFDLLIVDIFMPNMDGLEAIKTFKRLAPEVPIIAMSGFTFAESGSGAPDFLSMATKLGAAHSLRKPFRPKELRAAVATCLNASAQAHAAHAD